MPGGGDVAISARPAPAGRPAPLAVRGPETLVLEQAAQDGVARTGLGGLLERLDFSKVGLVVGLALFAASALVLDRLLRGTTLADVTAAMQRIDWSDILLAGLATAASYSALIGYDGLALRHVAPGRVPARAIAFTSFVSHAFTYTLGFGILTGGAIRWRMYQAFGLKPQEIVGVGLLTAVSFWLGLAAVAALCLTIAPGVIAPVDHLDARINLAVGLVLLGGLAAWVATASRRGRTVTVSDWAMPLPGVQATLGAILVGVLDTAAAAFALWLILPAGPDPGFASFLVVFAIATVLGVISHVPGGVGVFEASLVLALPQIPQADLLGSLLLYRILYYAVPFAIAATLLGAHELRDGTGPVGRLARTVGGAARPIVPRAAGVAVFLGGVVLLLSGATPEEVERMRALRHILPLPFVETSHFAGSVVGLVLLVVAYGLVRRMANAWRLAIGLLCAGALFSILKGLDIEEATVCAVVAVLLVISRREFYRQADLFSVRPSFEWILAMAVAVGTSVWLGLFVSRNVEYQNVLWWQFTTNGDAPRFLRATLGVAVAAIGIGAYIVLHRRGTQPRLDPVDLERAVPIIAGSERAEAHLALLGDKRFLFAPDSRGLVMYGVQGRTWVAMGDPVSPEEEIDDLVWQFRELVDRHGGKAVFYQVTAQNLPTYLDAGFNLVKLGEEAWVDLARFTLEGGEGRRLRQARAKAERTGASLEIVPAAEVPGILDELEAVSDAWLEQKGNREKGFSLGFWSRTYVARYDVAVIRHGGRIVAFANIWRGAGRQEVTVDLMRQAVDAPAGIMDLLFIGLMQRAKEEGYGWFNLGMAPLSGLPTHRLASLWSRIGAFLYRRGDRFYNFEGLRAFKDKFKPDWRPKYLAFPGGLALPQILMDVTALIASSPRLAAAAGRR